MKRKNFKRAFKKKFSHNKRKAKRIKSYSVSRGGIRL